MLKKRILYIYPTERQQIYERWENGSGPSTLMYGLCELKKEKFDVFFVDTSGFKKKIFKYLFLPFEFLFYKSIGISLHFDHVLSQFREIKKSGVIISSFDSTSLPILFLKKIGLLRGQEIICLSIDLINRNIPNFVCNRLGSLFRLAKKIIVFSKEEEKLYREKWHLTNVQFVQFGIDANFFLAGLNHTDQRDRKYVLTVGRDRSRDYEFFLETARNLSRLNFVAICSQKNISDLEVPDNVKVLVDVNYKTIKKWMSKSFCFLLPMHELHRASGQIAFLEAVASGMPIIASSVSSIKDNYNFSEKDGVFILGSDIVEWIDKIKKIAINKTTFVRNNIPRVENISNFLASEILSKLK